MGTKITVGTVLCAMALSAMVVSCTKEEMIDEAENVVPDEEGMTKAVGSTFINGLDGWDSFNVNTRQAELGEFEANINNTGRVTIRTESATKVKVGDGGNYPQGVCDGPVPNNNGFRFAKGAAGDCGRAYFITPRNSGANGQALKVQFMGGILPALPAGQSWFTVSGANGTWTANATAGNFFCWSLHSSAPVSACE
ncbi:MAG: hypothetical protein WAU70_03225 [Flavobacteriales bacterium]